LSCVLLAALDQFIVDTEVELLADRIDRQTDNAESQSRTSGENSGAPLVYEMFLFHV